MRPLWVWGLWIGLLVYSAWEWWRDLDSADKWLMGTALFVVVALLW